MLLIINLKSSLKFRKKKFRTKNTKNFKNLLNLFLRLNIIKEYKIVSYKYIDVFLNTNNFSLNKELSIISTSKNKYYISLKGLEKLKRHTNVTYILETSKGVITDLEALNFHVGGILFFKIFN